MDEQLLKSLYDEYGQENVSIARRQFTIDNGRQPNYIELLAALCLKEGWQTPPAQAQVEIAQNP